MSLLSLVGISNAYATAAGAGAHPASASEGFLSMLPMLIIFVAVFYFLLVRPQQKRAKEHKNLMSSLSVGDEIVTTGGIVGRLTELKEQFMVLTIAKDVKITMQKNAIANVLPKGTMDASN